MHVGIIMDGNRRYARGKGEVAYAGHAAGFETLKQLLIALHDDDLGITELSLYAFSTENFKRDDEEVERSFELFRRARGELTSETLDNCRVRFVGRLELFPDDIRQEMRRIEENHQNGERTINFLVGYNGQDEIVDAAKRIAAEGVEEINRETIRAHSYLPDSKPVDLIIRTGMTDGARISGFMLWHASYAELMFLTEYWPEFSHERLKACIDEYNARERRFGR